MKPPVRLGAVDYLNVRPLVYGLDARPEVSLRFDTPAVCADLLAQGVIDLGMVPSIAYFDRPGDRIVPGICIGSDGAVASVALFTRRPIADVRTIAIDSSSRTSAALTRILCDRTFGIAPAFVTMRPDLAEMLRKADAALLIGDAALFADYRALGAEKIDLGTAWTELTGLPFVWACWAGRPDAAGPAIVELVQRAAETGMKHSDAIADAYCAPDPARQALARQYLRDNLMFRLSDRAIEGLNAFYREAQRLNLGAAGRIEFFDAADPPG